MTDKKKAIIVDIDDTINIQNPVTLKACEGPDGFDWDLYIEYLESLPSREPVIEMVNELAADFEIIVLTARKGSEEYWQITRDDLLTRGVTIDKLVMMPPELSEQCNQNNYKTLQTNFKIAKLVDLQSQYDIVLVIDDLKPFCSAAANMGICTINPLLAESLS